MSTRAVITQTQIFAHVIQITMVKVTFAPKLQQFVGSPHLRFWKLAKAGHNDTRDTWQEFSCLLTEQHHILQQGPLLFRILRVRMMFRSLMTKQMTLGSFRMFRIRRRMRMDRKGRLCRIPRLLRMLRMGRKHI